MKKRLRKLLAIALTATMVMSMGAPAFATTEKEISIEEYEMQIQSEAKKYGIEYEVLEYDPNKVIPQEMADKAVKDIQLYGEYRTAQNISNSNKFAATKENANVMASNNELLRAIPMSKNVSGSFSIIVFPYGRASMAVDANVTVDAQNNAVMRVNSTDVYQLGNFVNFTGWTTTSVSPGLNSPELGWVSLLIKGRATFAYADPVTGVTSGHTEQVTEVVEINCI